MVQTEEMSLVRYLLYLLETELNWKAHHKVKWSILKNTNLLLTEREGRTGEYWPEVVTVRTERSEVRTKRRRANIPRYGPSKLG